MWAGKNNNMEDLELFFKEIESNVIGHNATFDSPYGKQTILYADWVASARMYQPIEDKISEFVLPFVANTHTESNVTGTAMTRAYNESKKIIKRHVNASESDNLIFCGSGMTAAIAKLQRILGLKIPERFHSYLEGSVSDRNYRKIKKRSKVLDEKYSFKEHHKPIVFVTHMEHHSNHTSWLETIADVKIIKHNENGEVCLDHFAKLLEKYKERTFKIASVTACSNVTGIESPYHEIAKMVHAYDGVCFADFAASAPYVDIDMHPEEEGAHLDAIFFSPHKFLGGPGTPGVLIFNEALYCNKCPDIPGGGTVSFTSPWYTHDYISDIEVREDGGTPPFIQGIRAAMAVKLKEHLTVDRIKKKKNHLLDLFFKQFDEVEDIHFLANKNRDRHGIVSFYVKDLHYNLLTKVLNDRYGIQVRGGCACAGTYGHILFDLDINSSNKMRKYILEGDNTYKLGFVRVSLHPTLSTDQCIYIADSIKAIIEEKDYWKTEYVYDNSHNEYHHAKTNVSITEDKILDNIYSFENSKLVLTQ